MAVFSHMLDHTGDNFRLIRFFGRLMWYGGSPNSQILFRAIIAVYESYLIVLLQKLTVQYNLSDVDVAAQILSSLMKVHIGPKHR